VTSTFEAQLEEALLQSKLEFQKQQPTLVTGDATTSSESKSKKKKKVPVPITQFHEMMSMSSASNANEVALPHAGDDAIDEDALIERLRAETHLELLKEKQHAEEKAILLSRNAVINN